MILKIVDRIFELVQTINGEWGELLDLVQCENEKIIISSTDYLLILEKINIDNHHAFDKQLLKLYDKLGIPRVNINNFNQGSKAMVFNGEVNDSTIIN